MRGWEGAKEERMRDDGRVTVDEGQGRGTWGGRSKEKNKKA